MQAAARPRLQRLRPLARDRRAAGRRGAGGSSSSTLMDEQVARLEELLELHEEIAGDDAAELADRVSSDDSVAGERRRRQQAAKSRELRQTIELLMKMRKARIRSERTATMVRYTMTNVRRRSRSGRRLRRLPRRARSRASLGWRRSQRPRSVPRTGIVRRRCWRW